MNIPAMIPAAFRRDPVRAVLTILGVGVGAAIVTLTVNVGNGLLAAIHSTFPTPGLRMVVATAERDAQQMPVPRTDILSLSDMEALRRLVPGATAVAAVEGTGSAALGSLDLSSITVDGASYRTRSSAAVGGAYAAVYALEPVAGTFFGPGEEGAALVISESAARALFGSAAAAVGRTVGARRRPDDRAVLLTVCGVYRDAPFAVRDAYDIADFLVPIAAHPSALGAFAVLVDAADAERAADLLVDAVRSLHGAATPTLAWHGGRWDFRSSADRLAGEARRLVLFIDAFGALALVIASTGILTTMMVSVLERARAASLRRALGARRGSVVGWFVGEALLLTGAGALLGVVAAAAFSAPVVEALRPIFPGADDGLVLPAALRLDAILLGAASALAAGAVFSLPPALAAAAAVPAEGMRDAT